MSSSSPGNQLRWSRKSGHSSAQKQVIGTILFLTMLFFSALAFTILENAMSVIFYHRVKIRRRHFLVSAVMPYLFILFLGVGLLIVTVLSGVSPIRRNAKHHDIGQPRSLDQISIFLLYILGVTGEMLLLTAIYFVMPVGRLSLRHASDRRGDGHGALGNDAPHSGLVLHDDVANPDWFTARSPRPSPCC